MARASGGIVERDGFHGNSDIVKVSLHRANKRQEHRPNERKERKGKREGSRVDVKFGRAISCGVAGQKGTQCRGQDRFSSVERITDERMKPRESYVARRGAGPHCC